MKTERRATFAVLMSGVSWGVISIPVKAQAAAGLGALQIAALRLVFAVALFFLILAIFDREKLRVAPRDLWMFLCTGCISVGMCNLLYSYTMLKSGAAVSVVLMYTSPVIIMLLSALFFAERITAKKLIALALSICGCVLVTGLFGSGEAVSLPIILTGLGSGLAYALYTIFGRVALKKYDAITVTAYSLLFGAIGLLPFSDLGGAAALVRAQPSLLLWVLGSAAFCTVLPYGLYTWGLQRMESGKAAILACVEPMVGSLLGMAVFGEYCSVGKLAGIALIICSVVLLSVQKEKAEDA